MPTATLTTGPAAKPAQTFDGPDATAPCRDEPRKKPSRPPVNLFAYKSFTDALIDPSEPDDDALSESNRGSVRARVSSARKANRGEVDDMRIRSELARSLRMRTKRMLDLIGDVAISTHIAMLKRDMSKAYDLLLDARSEQNFISMVALVEGVLSQGRGQELAASQIRVIYAAFDTAYRSQRLTHDDVESIRHRFSEMAISSGPMIDLEQFSDEMLEMDFDDDSEATCEI